MKSPVREVRVVFYRANCFPHEALGPLGVTVAVDHARRASQSSNSDQQLPIHLLLWPHPAVLETVYQEVASQMPHWPKCSVGLLRRPVARVALWGANTAAFLAKFLSCPPNHTGQIDIHRHKFFQACCRSQSTLFNVWRPNEVLALDSTLTVVSPIGEEVTDANASPSVDKKFKLRWPTRAADSALWAEVVDETRGHEIKESLSEQSGTIIKAEGWSREEMIWKAWESMSEKIVLGQATAEEVLRNHKATTPAAGAEAIPLLLTYQRPVKGTTSLVDRIHGSPVFHMILPLASVPSLLEKLVKSQCVAVGRQEVAYLQTRQGQLTFPQDFLDCAAGWDFWQDSYQRQVDRVSRRPPSKRQLPAFHRRWDGASMLAFGIIARWLRSQEAVYNSTTMETSDAVAVEEMDGSAPRPVFVVVRNEQYLTAFQPSDQGTALPPLPQLTMLHVQLRPIARGIPRSAALIIGAIANDAEFLRELYLTKQKGGVSPLQSAYVKKDSSHRCTGVHISKKTVALLSSIALGGAGAGEQLDSVDGRPMLGFVTSGLPPHTNHSHRLNRYGDSAQFCSVGFAQASLLHSYISSPSTAGDIRERNDLVFFWNFGSHWLRPAIVKLM